MRNDLVGLKDLFDSLISKVDVALENGEVSPLKVAIASLGVGQINAQLLQILVRELVSQEESENHENPTNASAH